MLDPLLTLLAAKAKAVGLVAGTALVTATLVGGGAVAMTAVSHDGLLDEETTVEQVVEGEQVALPSDTPTVGITNPEQPEVEPREDDTARPPLPADFTCDESQNHGQNVSTYARSLPKGPGRGEQVSAVAQSDCGNKDGTQQTAEDADAQEPKADKPENAAKPDKPAPGAGKGRPDDPGKSAGKGGGKGGP